MYRKKARMGAAYLAGAALGTAVHLHKRFKKTNKPIFKKKVTYAVSPASLLRKKKLRRNLKTTGGGSETEVRNSEFSRNSVTIGRKEPHNLRSAWKLLNQNLVKNIYSFRQYGSFAGAFGLNTLENSSTTSSTGTLYCPIRIYDITAAPNVVSGVATYPLIAWAPTFSDPTAAGTISWTQGSQLAIENVNNATTIVNNFPGGSDTLRWVQVKLLFFAPLIIPSTIQVDIVQIKDDRLYPDLSNTSTMATAFWQSALKKFMKNPLEPGDHKYSKYFKILYTQSFIMEPKLSVEAVSTNMVQKNIFLRLNRKCSYDWQDQDKMGMLTNSEGQINTDTTMSTFVDPKARIYLMIRGQAGNSTAFTQSLHPSYDIVLRTCHENFQS